jgi:hypothetical protein
LALWGLGFLASCYVTGRKSDHRLVCLPAVGSSGPWEVAIDETLSGSARRFVQIEGPSVCLYFEIPKVEMIDRTLDFFGAHSPNGRPSERNVLSLGKKANAGVSLIRDDEFNDRYFLVIEYKTGPQVRFTIANNDLSHIVKALRDAKNDLEDGE